MSMHEQWTDRFSEYLDGELSDAGGRAIDAHLLQCADCARTLEELRQVVAAARALPSTAPTSDLWGGISRRLDTAGRPHVPAQGAPPAPAFPFRAPQPPPAAPPPPPPSRRPRGPVPPP